MTFYLCILFVLVVLITYVDSNLRCYSCSPCNELEIYAGDVTHFEQDCYLDRYCMKVRRILQYLKSFRKIREITLVYIFIYCVSTLDFRHYWRHFWVKTRSIISRMPVDFNLYSIRRRLHWNITGRYYNIKNFFSKKFFKIFFLVAGLGLVQGVVCFCQGHLCNGAISTSVPISMLSSIVSILLYFLISWNIPQKNRWL